MIYNSVAQLIGNTPVLELTAFVRDYGLESRIFAKLELLNPAGSAKDRVAKRIIEEAEADGRLKAGGTIIESTSGNTGIGLASVGISRGYEVIIVMPDTMSKERIKTMEAYGATVILSDGALGMKGANELALDIASRTENAFIAAQFENMANPNAHYLTTGPEIYEDTDGEITALVAGIGTGGTISGAGKYLKERNPDIKVYGAEPEDSPVINGGKPGGHKIQGIGAGFVPETLDLSVVDKVVTVGTEEAYELARAVAQKEGFLVGISSGAALAAAIKLSKEGDFGNGLVVVMLPDTGDRYLSTDLYN